MQNSLNLAFSATPDRFTLESAKLTAGSSTLVTHAEILDYADPKANVDYEARVHAQDFTFVAPMAAPSGDISVTGKLRFEQKPNQPLLTGIAVTGEIASSALAAAASGRRIEIHDLHSTYQFAENTLRVSGIRAQTFGGSLDGDFEIQAVATTPVSRLRASLHNISLRAIHDALHRPELKTVALSGTLNGAGEALWTGSVSNVRVHADLTIRAGASRTSNRSGEVPLDGAIHVTYDGPRQSLALHETTIRIPSATLTAQGEISAHSNLLLQLSASDFHQLVMLASSLSTSQWASPAVSGSGLLTATVHGSMQKPVIAAHFNAQHLQVEGSEWSNAAMDIQANPSQLALQNGSLVNARQGKANFSASAGLQNWSYTPSSSIQATLEVQHLQIKSLLQLAKQNYPVAGDLSANLSLHGTQLDPVGSGTAQIANAVAYAEPLQRLTLKFKAEKGQVVSTANLTLPAGAIDVNLHYTPKTKPYTVRLNAPAIVLQNLQTIRARNVSLTGTVNASVTGQGPPDHPPFDAIVRVPELQLQQGSISGLDGEIHLAQHRADITLDSKVSEAFIKARGHVDLVGDYYTDAAIDTSQVSLAPLLQAYLHNVPEGFQGQTELHATLKGALKDQSKLEAHLSIPTLNASYKPLQVGLTAPIQVDYANSVVTLHPTQIRGPETHLPVDDRHPPAAP